MNKQAHRVIFIDKIIYFWSILFILPIIYVLLFNLETVIRNFNYVWVALFIGYLIFNQRRLIKNNKSLPPTTISIKAKVIFFLAVFISLTFSLMSKLYSFHENAWDFGIFQSMLEAILQGNLGYSSVVGFYHFGTHQNYILFLILPVYYLLHSAATLQMITVFAILFQGIILWQIAREYQLNLLAVFFTVASFFLSPFNGIVCGFHPELLAPTFFAAAYLFYIRKRLIYFIFMIMLLAMCKEECVLYIMGFGVYLWLNKKYSYATIAIMIALAVVSLNNFIVQPYFVHKSGMLNTTTLSFWSVWGTTKSQIAFNILTHPWQVGAAVFSSDSGLWKLYGLFGFLLFFDSFLLLTSIFAILLLATALGNVTMYHYGGYSAVMLNIIFFISLARVMHIISSDNNILCKEFFILKKLLVFYNWLFRDRLQQLFMLLIIIFPLIGFGYQRFYPISFNDIRDFNQVRQLLLTKYKNKVIAPEANLYPNLLDLPLDFGVFNHDNFFMQANRVIVFTPIGDQWPFTRQQLLDESNRLKNQCDVIGSFYICNPKKLSWYRDENAFRHRR